MSYIYIVCLALILFFSFSLIVKPKKALSEKFFVAWIILLAVTELGFFLHSIGLFSRYLLLFSILCDTHVLHGVFFYFYVRSFVDKAFTLKRIHLLNILPFVFLFSLKWYFNEVLGVMDCYGTGCLHDDNRYVNLLSFLKFFILGAYLFAGWYYVNSKKMGYSKINCINHIRITWINNITIGVFVLFSMSVIYKVIYWLGFGFLGNDILVVNILVSFFIMIFLYMGNSYGYLFVAPKAGVSIPLDDSQVGTKKSPATFKQGENELDIENIDGKFEAIEDFVKSQQPYLTGQYTIRALSEEVNISQNEISQIIIQKANIYYCEYMNKYRVETLKRKLDDESNDRFTIFSLAMDCGFASKTSYNRIFKNHTGITPSDYRAQQGRD